LTLGDPAYPPALLETADPPLVLYAQGRLALLASPSLAIVGSRHATTGAWTTRGPLPTT
jgi:DNA processing protein